LVIRLLAGGYAVRCGTRNPAAAEWLNFIPGGTDNLTLHSIDSSLGSISNPEQLDNLLEGCSTAYFCAGFEKQEPATITFMVDSALAILASARRKSVECVVLTSSGGSTNPPGLDPATPKSEILHWSDPEVQQGAGKYSPAAKTLMETAALQDVGRDQSNNVIDEEKAAGAPRLVILNPNLILGPQLQPGCISGNSLPWVVRILKGESMSEKVPNDSMSIIDVRDLASLHVAAAENTDASGRYWGVNRSWPWEEILSVFEEVAPGYKAPPRFEGESKLPTQFDHTRKESLGIELRSLKETMADLVSFLKEKGAY